MSGQKNIIGEPPTITLDPIIAQQARDAVARKYRLIDTVFANLENTLKDNFIHIPDSGRLEVDFVRGAQNDMPGGRVVAIVKDTELVGMVVDEGRNGNSHLICTFSKEPLSFRVSNDTVQMQGAAGQLALLPKDPKERISARSHDAGTNIDVRPRTSDLPMEINVYQGSGRVILGDGNRTTPISIGIHDSIATRPFMLEMSPKIAEKIVGGIVPDEPGEKRDAPYAIFKSGESTIQMKPFISRSDRTPQESLRNFSVTARVTKDNDHVDVPIFTNGAYHPNSPGYIKRTVPEVEAMAADKNRSR